MKKVFLFTMLVAGIIAHGQYTIKPGRYEQALSKGGTIPKNISIYVSQIISSNGTITLSISKRAAQNNTIFSSDTVIANAVTMAPIYYSSFSKANECVVHYSKDEVTGYYLDKITKQKTIIHDAINSPVIDANFFPYMLTMLPLTPGLKKSFTQYSYVTPLFETRTAKASIASVEEDTYTSTHSGDRQVWRVTVKTLAPTGDEGKYIYYIDKETRRLWKIDIEKLGQNWVVMDTDNPNLANQSDDGFDYSAFKNKFDKEATLKLITKGSAIITGQAFARENDANIKGMAILNLNKKQLAPKGTYVSLIPDTDFFKEWYDQSKKAAKRGQSIPLPQEVKDCIVLAQVTDNEGHFEFDHLMPGDYLLYTQFAMTHKASQTYVTGYTDNYIAGGAYGSGVYQGTTTNTATNYFNVLMTANAQKIVTIKQDGETVTIKLKQVQQ